MCFSDPGAAMRNAQHRETQAPTIILFETSKSTNTNEAVRKKSEKERKKEENRFEMSSRFSSEQVANYEKWRQALPNAQWRNNLGDLNNFAGFSEGDFVQVVGVPPDKLGEVKNYWRQFKQCSFLFSLFCFFHSQHIPHFIHCFGCVFYSICIHHLLLILRLMFFCFSVAVFH